MARPRSALRPAAKVGRRLPRVRVNRPVIGRRAHGPPARRRPKPCPTLRLQPSPRRTGPVVALDEGCASIACRLVALPSPASRPSTPRGLPSCNPAPASIRPVDARLGPVRPASARRPASEPPSTRPHTPNRQRGAFLWPAQPGSDSFGRRSAACRPPISARSGAIRPSTRPWAVHVAASPPAGSRSSCPAAAYADPSGTPGTPTPAPRSVPDGGRDARAHICPRVRRGNFQKEKSERGAVPVQADSQELGLPTHNATMGARLWRR